MFPEIMIIDAEDRGILPPPTEFAWDRARFKPSELLENGTDQGKMATQNINLKNMKNKLEVSTKEVSVRGFFRKLYGLTNEIGVGFLPRANGNKEATRLDPGREVRIVLPVVRKKRG